MHQERPQTYEQWLSEVKFSNTLEDTLSGPGIITAAQQVGRLNPNKKAARHDIALVLADKYRGEAARAGGHPMLIRTIDEKFNKISQILFKSSFESLYNYVIKNEPSFDPVATNLAKGGAKLGCMGQKCRTNEQGVPQSNLGFLGGEATTGGSLGFL